MPEKVKHRAFFFHLPFHHGHHDHRPSSSSSSPAPAAAPASPVHTFSATMMEENTSDAEEINTASPSKKQTPEKAKHRAFFFHSPFHHGHHDHRPSSSSPAPAAAPASPVHTFSATMMEDNINDAEEIITRWDPQQGSSHAKLTSLFRESREEAPQFLRAVADLQRAMNFFVGGSHSSSSALLVRAHTIMEAAMRRLQKEFYQMLAANRDRLDPESSISGASDMSSLSLNSSSSSLSDAAEEEETSSPTESVGEVDRASTNSMADLRSIAECMVSSGYGKECVKIYRLVRRSIVDEALYKLGFEKLSPTSNPHKLHEWDAVLDIRIRNWLAASKVAVRTLFSGERVLCDQVFSSSDSICQSCFAEITAEPATQLFKFPETVVASKKIKISPENMFRILDMYDCISELWPDVDSIFSYQSTAAVRSQANASLLRLGGAVRSTLVEFESAIQRDNHKAAVPGGGLHPLSRYVMNYLAFLADYSSALEDIFAEHPLQAPSTTPLPAPLFDDMIISNSAPSSPSSSREEEPCWFMSPVSARIAWLVLVLLCKLDSKAELYTEAAMAYLFLANNLWYVVNKVRRSRLLELLGESWVAGHEAKARGYAASYERLAWTNVQAAIPDDPAMDAQAAREHMRRFNEAFEGTCRAQAGWVVEDGKMREQLKLSIAGKLLQAYSPFYERSRLLLLGERSSPAAVRFTPEDIANYLSDLFCGGAGDGSSVSSVPGSSVSGSSERSSRFM